MNKKGSIIDIIIWVIAGIITIFVLGILIYAFSTIETELSDIGMVGNMNMSNITEQTFGQVNESLAPWLHTIAVIIIIMSGISILIHNFLVKAHPAFFISYFFVTIGAVIASTYISNEYMKLLSNEVLGTTFSGFTGANFIMQWLPYFTTVIGIFGFIFLFIGIIRDKSGGVTL